MNLVELLTPIIKNAGKILLDACDRDTESNVIEKNGDANFVTEYDVKTQEFLMSEIKKAIPSAEFIAEEKDNDPEVLKAEYCLIIDPIDGTTNFIHGYKQSSISVAVFSCGDPLLGAVYDPYLDELFIAERGKGAYLNGRRIKVSDRSVEKAVISYGTSPYYKKELGDKTFGLCKDLFDVAADVRRTGSAAIDLAYLAAGRTDGFFEFRLSPWDIAAGYVLICEAGGIITDMNGKKIDFSCPSSVIAANRQIYETVLELSKEYN